MPRIRAVKPEFTKDENLATLSREHRLFLVLIAMLADKAGRLEERPAWFRVELYPYDVDLTPETVMRWIQDLDAAGFLRRYEHEGRRYLWIPSFRKDQRPSSWEKDKTTSVIPPCPGDDFTEEVIPKRTASATKQPRSAPAVLEPEFAEVHAAIKDATGIDYPSDCFGTLREAIRAGKLTAAEAAAVIRSVRRDDYWAGKRNLSPGLIFGSPQLSEIVAKVRAEASGTARDPRSPYRTIRDISEVI